MAPESQAKRDRYRHLESVFFADKHAHEQLNAEREKELGAIISEARECVEAELRHMYDPVFREEVAPLIDRIRGVQFEDVSKMQANGQNNKDVEKFEAVESEIGERAKLDDDVENEEMTEKQLYESFNLDEEEIDILRLLTGDRPPREGEVLPDEDLMRDFSRLKRRFHYAQDAELELLEGNLQIVITIASQYRKKGLPFMDLLQEGYKGAHLAARRYNPDHGCKFSTYAGWWVRQRIVRLIKNYSREIRYPQHVSEQLNRLKWAYREIPNDPKRKRVGIPTVEELAEKTEFPVWKIEKLLKLPQVEKVLDAPTGSDEGGATMHDILADSRDNSADKEARQYMLRSFIDYVLEGLNDNEKLVIIKRFGLEGNDGMTLEEIGGIRNITRERVRQIEVQALRKVRNRFKDLMRENKLGPESFI